MLRQVQLRQDVGALERAPRHRRVAVGTHRSEARKLDRNEPGHGPRPVQPREAPHRQSLSPSRGPSAVMAR